MMMPTPLECTIVCMWLCLQDSRAQASHCCKVHKTLFGEQASNCCEVQKTLESKPHIAMKHVYVVSLVKNHVVTNSLMNNLGF